MRLNLLEDEDPDHRPQIRSNQKGITQTVSCLSSLLPCHDADIEAVHLHPW